MGRRLVRPGEFDHRVATGRLGPDLPPDARQPIGSWRLRIGARASPRPWHSRHMASPELAEIRLGAFKSHKQQVVRLRPLTLLVGPNASGKSNVIDALSVLALLADERALADLERGDESVAGLRGGLSGAAPFGGSRIRLGCTVRSDLGDLRLDFELDAERAEVVSERLVLGNRTLLDSHSMSPGSGIVNVDAYSGGAPKRFTMLASRLSIVQAATRIPTDTRARRQVVAACAEVTAALRGVFVLDPVPGRMRDYAQIGGVPDRLGANTSAVVYDLLKDAATGDRLLDLVRGLVGADVVDLSFAKASIEGRDVDVMVALTERAPGGEFLSQARVMSDGTLRYLAIVSTLLQLARVQPGSAVLPAGRPTFVVEEIENGLFPTQASRILDLLRDEAKAHRTNLLATTHSPALLDALHPEDHEGVVICARDSSGYTVLQRLVEHPRYVEIAGGGRVGSAVAKGQLGLDERTFDLEGLFE